MHSNGVNGAASKTVSEQQALSLALLKNTKANGTDQSPSLLDFLTEKVTISDTAKEKLASEQSLMKFARLASRLQEPFDLDKVKALQDKLSTQGTQGYLQSLSPNALASSMLQGFWK